MAFLDTFKKSKKQILLASDRMLIELCKLIYALLVKLEKYQEHNEKCLS